MVEPDGINDFAGLLSTEKVAIHIRFNPSENTLPVPLEYLGQIKIVESINGMVPSFEIQFADKDGWFQDRIGTAEVSILFETYSPTPLMFSVRGFILAQPEIGSTYVQDLGMAIRIFKGFIYFGMDIFGEAKRRAFRNSNASDVFQRILNEDLRPSKRLIEPSLDMKTTYIQPGWTNSQFISHLANRAISRTSVNGSNASGYLAWFDLDPFVGDIDPNTSFIAPYRACFVSPSYLIRSQEVKHKVVFTQDPNMVNKTFQNNGKNHEGEYVGLGYSNMYQTTFNMSNYVRRSGYFDLENKKYGQVEYKYETNSFPKLTDSKDEEQRYDAIYKNIKSVGRVMCLGTESERESKSYRYTDLHRHIFKRTMGLLTIGAPDIKVGDKVETRLPLVDPNKPISESMTSKWIVTKKAHVISSARVYLTKFELSTDEYRGNFNEHYGDL